MTQAPALSPDLIRQSIALARALSAAARTWGLYPPEHPAVEAAVRRLLDTVRASTGGAAFAFGVTPDLLLVAGLPLPAEPPVAEAARLLHDRDIQEISFLGDVPADAAQRLLQLLATAPADLRAAGGAAARWAAEGHPSVALQQFDYEKLLEDRDDDRPVERRDDVWQSIVQAIVLGEHEFNEAQQQRLLAISHSPGEIGALASDVIEPKRNLDGSPLITTQAATVLAVFRHLTGIVAAKEPERLPDVMRNVATASAALDPNVVLQMMQTDEGVQDSPIVARIAAAFDDATVAQLLATALAKDGRATARLAQVFDTIAPDAPRKQRVLTMAHSMLTEADFGRSGQFRAVWASMETLLLGYDESPYVSTGYQASLEGAAARADAMAGRELPEELPAWVETLEQDNVRTLSVLLITDLLRLEEQTERAAELTRDMVALADDLFLAGDFANALTVLRELERASAGRVAPAAGRAALTSVADSAGLREAATLLGEFDAGAVQAFTDCCLAVGPAVVRALYPALQDEHETPARARAAAIVVRFGAKAAPHLAGLTEDQRWFVQRNAAQLLGATRSADAVPALQALLRRGDPRVMGHAVAALSAIDDPAAARAVQTSLRAASGDSRSAVIEALVAERDPRVVPMLARIMSDTDPFGPDHEVVLGTLDAVRRLGHEAAVPSVDTVMRRTKWFAGRKARAFKTAAVQALAAIGTPAAQAALQDAARTGDRTLRRIIQERAR